MKIDPTSATGQSILRACKAVTRDDADISIELDDGIAYVWLWDNNRKRATAIQLRQIEYKDLDW